ncbi:MAG TPA: macro domain-containing protein [Acidobacteriota bacterium]|nr:macro domain-containing protein [Acidobacteriota bacterium]
MKYKAGNTTIIVKRADITEEDSGAIVNAANSHLQHGAGVAGAIVRKGGRIIQEESDRIGYVPVGSAAITTGGDLKAPYVIHAVGPRMGEGEEDEKLRNATANSLRLADGEAIHTISLPAISTGIFGYPMGRCAEIMLNAVHKYCEGETRLQEVRFCLFDEAAEKTFNEAAKRIFNTTA